MNRKVLIITMICILTVLAGCGKKAEPIDLPSNEAVISIEVITLDGAKADITEANQIETVMTALSATISINTVGESTVVYYYDKDSKHYIEQPYRGIYEMEDYLEETLLQE